MRLSLHQYLVARHKADEHRDTGMAVQRTGRSRRCSN